MDIIRNNSATFEENELTSSVFVATPAGARPTGRGQNSPQNLMLVQPDAEAVDVAASAPCVVSKSRRAVRRCEFSMPTMRYNARDQRGKNHSTTDRAAFLILLSGLRTAFPGGETVVSVTCAEGAA